MRSKRARTVLMAQLEKANREVLRDEKGRVVKGSTSLNPGGITKETRILHERIAKLAEEILEERAAGGPTLFERTVRLLLTPIIGVSLDREGHEIGERFLVNHATILKTLDFLTTVSGAAAHKPGEDDPGKKGGMIVVIHAPRPFREPISGPKAIDVKLLPERRIASK